MSLTLAWKKAVLFGLGLISLPLLMLCVKANFNMQTLQYQPIAEPISNPLMGWAPWASAANIKQPFSLVYADLTWREFESQRGVYDFDGFERKNQLAHWRSENKRIVFRFVCDRPGSAAHIDIPDWLYQAIDGNGDHYDNEYGKGFSPDYTNPVLIQAHREVIRALGERYGQDSFFAYIELGSLGHWGEWHVQTESGIRPLPVENIRNDYVSHYRTAFPSTWLLMRRPFRVAKTSRLGLYNDMTGDPDSTRQWLEWIANGGPYDQTGEQNALFPMASAWRIAPIGGEQTIGLSHEALYRDRLEETLQLLEQSHTTFIGPNNPAQLGPQSPLQPGIDRVMERIGYRLYVKQLQMPSKMVSARWFWMPVSMTFANDGIAPMYYPWPAQLYILDEAGSIRKTVSLRLDVRKILPGTDYSLVTTVPIDGLKPGSYTLGLAILDPITNRPAVRLAMENTREDAVQVLGKFEITSVMALLPR